MAFPQLRPPDVVLDIATKLEGAGFEAWFVGGAVRDALLGHPHLDWDLATSATPDAVREIFGHRRTIPVGIEFGTVGVLDSRGTMHEVTTFRRDVRTDGRHAVVEFGVSLEDDLSRRDFTINAIAYSASRRELKDPFDGRGDLARRVVRAVGDPHLRMAEDRLRALRAIRFAARFDFEIDAETLRAITESAPHLGRLSAERIKQELDKTMEQVRAPSIALRRWQDSGAFAALLPALTSLSAVELTTIDWLTQPTERVSGRPQRRVNRFAGMLAAVEPAQATQLMLALRASKQETQWVGTVLERWRVVRNDLCAALSGEGVHAANPTTGISDAQIRRWVAQIGRLHVGAVIRLALARWNAERASGLPAPTVSSVCAVYRRMLRSAFHDALDTRDLAIDGDDLRRAGIPAGPQLGKILHALLDAVLDDPARNDADWLLREAQRRFAER